MGDKSKTNGWYDAQGMFIPLNRVSPYEKKREKIMNKLIRQAEKASTSLAALKALAMKDVADLQDFARENHLTLGGKKGNVTLTSFGGDHKIEVVAQPFNFFDERFPTALELINKCIERWSQGSKAELVTLIRNYISPDAQGEYNTAKVIGLLKLKISDSDWARAMELLQESYRRGKTAYYVRFWKRIEGPEKWAAINLNIASV